MESKEKTPLESPAWQQPAPGNERNDNIKKPHNETIKPGGNYRSAEDDLDLDKKRMRTNRKMTNHKSCIYSSG